MEDITIKIDGFEGPLDLLLHLIYKNKIDIYDIPIAIITNQYLEYIKTMEDNGMEILSEFIVMAATLIEIKTKMLIPSDDSNEVEEDPRTELVERLLEYKLYKEMATDIGSRFIEEKKTFFRNKEGGNRLIDELLKPNVNDLLDDITLSKLKKVYESIILKLDNVEPSIDEAILLMDSYTVEERREFILDRLNQKKELYFSELFTKLDGKLCVIVTFLSLLELIRMQEIIVSQLNDDIRVKLNE